MLSDHERQQLDDIEQALVSGDRRLAATFGSGTRPAERRWMVRALLGFGALLVVVALLTGTDGLFLQGLLCLGGGFAWRRWQAARSRANGAATVADRHRGTRPDGTPPGWFRQV